MLEFSLVSLLCPSKNNVIIKITIKLMIGHEIANNLLTLTNYYLNDNLPLQIINYDNLSHKLPKMTMYLQCYQNDKITPIKFSIRQKYP